MSRLSCEDVKLLADADKNEQKEMWTSIVSNLQKLKNVKDIDLAKFAQTSTILNFLMNVCTKLLG